MAAAVAACGFSIACMGQAAANAVASTTGQAQQTTPSGGVLVIGQRGNASGSVNLSGSGASASSYATAYEGGWAAGGGNVSESVRITLGPGDVPIVFRVRASISAEGEKTSGQNWPYSNVNASAGASISRISGGGLGGAGISVQNKPGGGIIVPPYAIGEVVIGTAGEYNISFGATAGSQVATTSVSGARISRSNATVSWGLRSIPGEDKNKPQKYESPEERGATIYVPGGAEDVEIDEGASVPNDTTGAYLSVPVGDSFGVTDYVWAGSDIIEDSPDRPRWNPVYLFRSDQRMTKFTVPDALSSGDDAFELVLPGGGAYVLTAGQDFDFTEFFAAGITSFRLRGFNTDENLWAGEPFPFTHGLQFAHEGPAFVGNTPIAIGDYTQGGIVNADDLTVWKSAYSSSTSRDADGDNDGIVDGNDFLLWQRAFQGRNASIGASIPEPATAALCVLSTLLFLFRREAR